MSVSSDNSPIVLHGLNSIYLKTIGKWIRLDARGNKPGVNAEFSVEEEKLAYIVNEDIGEFDNHIVYSKPNYNVINSLEKYKMFAELKENLPSKI